jgi:hypothetical protein
MMTQSAHKPTPTLAQTSWQPRLLHPLMGADLGTLLRVLLNNGGVHPRCIPHAALAIATSVARLPFTSIEQLRTARLHEQMDRMPAPIFIIGHWRSGTTFLYEILCQSSQFAYVTPFAVGLPWDFLTITRLFGGVLERSLPEDRFIDSMAVHPDSPQEDEIGLASMQPVSFYHGIYFPKRLIDNFNTGIFLDGCSERQIEDWQRIMRLFFAKVQMQQAPKQLLIKNPVYTARVAMLRELFPGAKFIHIYRNPYTVFQSTRNFYWKLFKELALQSFDTAPVDELILNSYPRMMNAVAADTRDLPPNQFVELRFEEFEKDPVEHISRIYRQLELEGFDDVQSQFTAYLESRKRYRKNSYQFPLEDIKMVGDRWHSFIAQWGYEPPA